LRSNGYDIPILGQPADALAALARIDADLLIVTGRMAAGELRALSWALEGTGVEMLVAPSVPQLAKVLDIRPVAGLPLLYVDTHQVAANGFTATPATNSHQLSGANHDSGLPAL
jgi:hypothetical protein